MAAMTIQFSTPVNVFCYEVYLEKGVTLSQETTDFIFNEIWNAHDAVKIHKGRVMKKKIQTNKQQIL